MSPGRLTIRTPARSRSVRTGWPVPKTSSILTDILSVSFPAREIQAPESRRLPDRAAEMLTNVAILRDQSSSPGPGMRHNQAVEQVAGPCLGIECP